MEEPAMACYCGIVDKDVKHTHHSKSVGYHGEPFIAIVSYEKRFCHAFEC
jgi:hypothetical protein